MTVIRCVIGDLTRQPDCDAIVNSANPYLVAGGGVCGAIHQAAGPELEEASRRLAPLGLGEAVITRGYRLPNRWVIHVRGPVFGRDRDPPAALARSIANALKLAEDHHVRRIAFPAISTGIYGYPMAEAAAVMLAAAREAAGRLQQVEEIRFVVTHAAACAAFSTAGE